MTTRLVRRSTARTGTSTRGLCLTGSSPESSKQAFDAQDWLVFHALFIRTLNSVTAGSVSGGMCVVVSQWNNKHDF